MPTLIVALIVLIVIGLAIYGLIKTRKSNHCGHNCDCCNKFDNCNRNKRN